MHYATKFGHIYQLFSWILFLNCELTHDFISCKSILYSLIISEWSVILFLSKTSPLLKAPQICGFRFHLNLVLGGLYCTIHGFAAFPYTPLALCVSFVRFPHKFLRGFKFRPPKFSWYFATKPPWIKYFCYYYNTLHLVNNQWFSISDNYNSS